MNLELVMHVSQLVINVVFTDSFCWQSRRDMLIQRFGKNFI